MKKQMSVIAALAVACVSLLVVAPAAPAAPPSLTSTISDVTGTTASGATFSGTLSNIHFVNQRGQLAVAGLLSGTLSDASGTIGTVTDRAITLPVSDAAATGSCTILNLTLGPLDLNLLGLVVHLDQVHLLVTGQTGPGNLLGNLLCGVANALNPGGGGLAGLLNRLLGL
jgi:hypothetical protein